MNFKICSSTPTLKQPSFLQILPQFTAQGLIDELTARIKKPFSELTPTEKAEISKYTRELFSRIPGLDKAKVEALFSGMIDHQKYVASGTVFSSPAKEGADHPFYHRIILNTSGPFQLVLFISNESMSGGPSVIHDHSTLCAAKSLDRNSGESVYRQIDTERVEMLKHGTSDPKAPLLDTLKGHYIHRLIFPGEGHFAARLHLYLISPEGCPNKKMDYTLGRRVSVSTLKSD